MGHSKVYRNARRLFRRESIAISRQPDSAGPGWPAASAAGLARIHN
jgi:hypothetical protein